MSITIYCINKCVRVHVTNVYSEREEHIHIFLILSLEDYILQVSGLGRFFIMENTTDTSSLAGWVNSSGGIDVLIFCLWRESKHVSWVVQLVTESRYQLQYPV